MDIIHKRKNASSPIIIIVRAFPEIVQRREQAVALQPHKIPPGKNEYQTRLLTFIFPIYDAPVSRAEETYTINNPRADREQVGTAPREKRHSSPIGGHPSKITGSRLMLVKSIWPDGCQAFTPPRTKQYLGYLSDGLGTTVAPLRQEEGPRVRVHRSELLFKNTSSTR